MTLTITEPPADVDEKLRFKHPNIACELLTSDTAPINDALATNDVLNKLCSFLVTDNKLNPLLASFFSKTIAVLWTKRSELLFEYLKTREDFINLLLKHIETSAIVDLLLKLVTGIENLDLRAVVVKVSASLGCQRLLMSLCVTVAQ